MRPRVIADCDTGIDDALALSFFAQLSRAGLIDLSITTCAGNTTAQQAAINSREVLRLCGFSEEYRLNHVQAGAARPRKVPLTITAETHGEYGVGYWIPEENRQGDSFSPLEDVASDFLGGSEAACGAEEAVKAWERWKPTHILIAGPATNLAHAVEYHPEVLEGVQICLMGGAFLYPGNTTPTAEWNVWSDPHSLDYALRNWPEKTPAPVIVPLNVTEQVVMEPEQSQRVCAALRSSATLRSSKDLADFLESALRFYYEFHQKVGQGYKAQIHDLTAAMILLSDYMKQWRPRWDLSLRMRQATVAVEADSPVMRGTTVADWVATQDTTIDSLRQEVGVGGWYGVCGDGGSMSGGFRGEYWGLVPNACVVLGVDSGRVLAIWEELIVG